MSSQVELWKKHPDIEEIDVTEDKVATVEYNGKLYIIVFEK